MRFPERRITMKDGRTCILRPTAPDVAEEMIEYLKKTSGETPWLLRNPDEVNYTLEGEKEILSRVLEDPKSVMMVEQSGRQAEGPAPVQHGHRAVSGVLGPGHRYGDDRVPDGTGKTDRL